jgi:hypothetical protein
MYVFFIMRLLANGRVGGVRCVCYIFLYTYLRLLVLISYLITQCTVMVRLKNVVQILIVCDANTRITVTMSSNMV